MHLVVQPSGDIAGIYDEVLYLAALGHLQIRRASHVEPNDQGQWLADLSPVAGPLLGPFAHRSAALAAERAWLEAHWLMSAGGRWPVAGCRISN